MSHIFKRCISVSDWTGNGEETKYLTTDWHFWFAQICWHSFFLCSFLSIKLSKTQARNHLQAEALTATRRRTWSRTWRDHREKHDEQTEVGGEDGRNSPETLQNKPNAQLHFCFLFLFAFTSSFASSQMMFYSQTSHYTSLFLPLLSFVFSFTSLFTSALVPTSSSWATLPCS